MVRIAECLLVAHRDVLGIGENIGDMDDPPFQRHAARGAPSPGAQRIFAGKQFGFAREAVVCSQPEQLSAALKDDAFVGLA